MMRPHRSGGPRLAAQARRALSSPWAIHLATCLGAAVLMHSVWHSGGIYSPWMAWLLVLPLTPFYAIHRQAGVVWLWLVLLLQLAMAVSSGLGWVPAREVAEPPVLPSLLSAVCVTCALIVVPWLYDRLYRRALAQGRRHQRELEARRQALEQATAMREQFMATVSHELRTTMNTILGFNALLLTRVQDQPEALKVLHHTRQSAEHLMTVINDILDHSQLQTGQLVIQAETFELRQTLAHAFEMFEPRVKSTQLAYRLELDPDLPTWVHTDRHRLMQVLVNLLGNALKFTHQGEVVLRVQWGPSGALFSVTDTGIGIAPELQAQIFSPFSQAGNDIQARYGGHGLGLAISQKLAQLMGGDIGFDSTLGRGSRFWLRLPLTAVPAPSALPTRPTDAHGPALQSRARAWRFLIADDHAISRLLVKQVLQNAWPHCEILEAHDGQQALQCLRENPVDLVLMDMVMPVVDGLVATRTVRETWGNPDHKVPILGLTANVHPVDLDAFRQSGLSALMLKPFEPAQLCAQVEQLLLEAR